MSQCINPPSKSIKLKHAKAAIEVLHNLYIRSRFSKDEFTNLVCPMYRQETVSLLRRLYEWCIVDPTNIDDEKYLMSKKFAEVGIPFIVIVYSC